MPIACSASGWHSFFLCPCGSRRTRCDFAAARRGGASAGRPRVLRCVRPRYRCGGHGLAGWGRAVCEGWGEVEGVSCVCWLVKVSSGDGVLPPFRVCPGLFPRRRSSSNPLHPSFRRGDGREAYHGMGPTKVFGEVGVGVWAGFSLGWQMFLESSGGVGRGCAKC